MLQYVLDQLQSTVNTDWVRKLKQIILHFRKTSQMSSFSQQMKIPFWKDFSSEDQKGPQSCFGPRWRRPREAACRRICRTITMLLSSTILINPEIDENFNARTEAEHFCSRAGHWHFSQETFTNISGLNCLRLQALSMFTLIDSRRDYTRVPYP